MRFAVETLDRDGVRVDLPGTFKLVATGQALDRLLEVTPEGHAGRHLGDGRFTLNDMTVRFRPHEVLPFSVEYESRHRIADFALRILQ
jgi:hypothetical protein